MNSPVSQIPAPWQIAALIIGVALMLALAPIPDSIDMRDFDLTTLAALSRW